MHDLEGGLLSIAKVDMVRRIPILLHTGLHDLSCGNHAGSWQILLGVP